MTLPVPRLAVFYNGKDDKEDRILKLSDSFPEGTDKAKSDVEITVHMYNIKSTSGNKLLTECKTLSEYAWFVEQIRSNCETMDRNSAIDKTIEDMPEDFSIKSFLTEHRSEVMNMLITEYDETETMEMFKEEGRAEGREEGLEEGRKEERKNTERQRERAEKAEARVRELEEMLAAK